MKQLDPDDMPTWLGKLFHATSDSIIAGVNEDDCAVSRWSAPLLVVSTDFLNANPIAIELSIGGMRDLGRLIVASNLSDLCGSGAKPVAMLIGVTLPHGAKEHEFKELMLGVRFEAKRSGIGIIGGDSKLGRARALFGVAIGSAASTKELFLKNGARPGDILWVSGNLGSAAAAAWGYNRKSLDTTWRRWAKGCLLVPKIPLKKSRLVSSRKFGHGGTDISDGLGADLNELCKASGVGVSLRTRDIPTAFPVTAAARIAGVSPWAFAFASGGDFQFLVTTKPGARRNMRRYGFREIGEITKKNCEMTLPSGKVVPLPTKGHRDRRRLTFTEEIDHLIHSVDA